MKRGLFLCKLVVLNMISLSVFAEDSSHKKNQSPPIQVPSIPCPENWRLSGDFLYLLPTFDDTYFAIKSNSAGGSLNGKRINNDFQFKPAFRFGIEYALCNTRRELQAFYSYLEASQKKTISGSHLWATLASPAIAAVFTNFAGSASATLNCMYQRLDGNFSQQALNCYGMFFYIQPGLECSYLRLSENYLFQKSDSLASIDRKSKAWGVGPQIGVGLDYNFYEGRLSCSTTQTVSISSLFSGSILMGRATTSALQVIDGDSLINVNDEYTWRTIPALHARAGLNYLVKGCWCAFSAAIGYEFNTYLRALARTTFTNEIAIGENLSSPGLVGGTCSTNYFDFDVQGLYLTAAVQF